ncbi:S9 family peptidase [Cellulomonas shaoxiangyii]|uniref:S9 family peptidase n=1 Tax=Cellulomonas shaoxiangyii TaxID=2566013 RepID=A0A4P7SJN5_9CELL|nr:S9 family peptidase [Cellulomonas shaoxiangyii]QCB93918.1 S9 family peptidase [Cellulomonas shaoxiangyii]TGY85991.1 S9 family peptidase [Cellulomonas shaoxiangyii]
MIPADLDLLRTPGAPALLPDGSAAVVAVVGPDTSLDAYRGELWLVPVDASAADESAADGPDGSGTGRARRLTHGHRDTAPVVSPDGRWVAFCRAPLTGGPAQAHLVAATGGEPVPLTDAPLGVSAPCFSPDGERLAYVARVPEDGRYAPGGDPSAEAPRHVTTFRYRMDGVGFVHDRPQHVHVLTVPADPGATDALPEPVALTSGAWDVTDPRWLPDGDALVATCTRHAGRERDVRRDAVVVPARERGTDAAALPALTDADAGSTLQVAGVRPTADGAALWLHARDLGPDGQDTVAALTGLYRLPLTGTGAATRAAGVARRLTDPETTDLSDAVLVPLEDGALVAVEERGAVTLAHVGDDGTLRTLLDAPHVVLGADAPVAGGPAVVTAAGPVTSGAVLRVDPGTGAVATLADWSAPLRATGRVRRPLDLTATSPDGYEVHGWLVTPDPERWGAGPHPTLLMIHGGPFAQYTHALFDEAQVLAGAGYAVVLGNPRGSAGFGRAHGRAIRQAFGTVDTDDVLALLDGALAQHPDVLDGARTGALGGSYGGYLTAWLTTRTDRFAAAVVERGFLDPVSFTGSADIGWWFGLEYVGDHGTPEGLAAVAAQSPMAHVGRVRTPTLVVHSEQDWRCPVEQGQRWFVELRRRGVEAELLLFPGEGHELTRSGRPRHRVSRFEHLLGWWSRHLPAGAGVAAGG